MGLTTADWLRLRAAIARELPFPPPYQRQDRARAVPEPEHFDDDVWYHGDYGEGLEPLATIAWIRIRPRYLRRRGRLLAAEVVRCDAEMRALLVREGIPFVEEGGCFRLVSD